jgi:hypothetical protein
LVFCAVVLLVLPVVTAAQSVTLQPDNGPVGTEVTATGTGWPASAEIHAFFNQQEVAVGAVDAGGGFALTFCVPELAPGIHPTFFTISGAGMYSGPIFTITAGGPANCQPTAGCADAYFIGAHGTGEDENSPVIVETWEEFNILAGLAGINNVDYYSLEYEAPPPDSVEKIIELLGARDRGVDELHKHIRETVLKECKNPKIVLVGYSLGAWVIDEWLSKHQDLWSYIRAVELYGDPMWYRFGPAFPAATPETYKGLLRHLDQYPRPYENNPQGPGGELSKRWQSRCLVGDPICGEGYVGFGAFDAQALDGIQCNADPSCKHRQYHTQTTKLTTNGANFLFLKTFPDVFTTGAPSVAYYETFVEGDHVYIRLYYTGSPTGFGFVGANGAGWGLEEHLFSNPPYWARVSPNGDRVDYPFNHLCSTQPNNASDIEAWVFSDTQGGTPVTIHLACSAPEEVITPFFNH